MRRPLRILLTVCLLLVAVTPSARHRTREVPMRVDTVDIVSVSRADAPALRDLDAWMAWAAAQPRPSEGTQTAERKPRGLPVRYGSGACGGDLPPCSVMMCESGGNLAAQNPRSTASGKWQFLDSTWAGYGGYSRAMYAPEEVQDAKARQVWAGGAGRGQWVCN